MLYPDTFYLPEIVKSSNIPHGKFSSVDALIVALRHGVSETHSIFFQTVIKLIDVRLLGAPSNIATQNSAFLVQG